MVKGMSQQAPEPDAIRQLETASPPRALSLSNSQFLQVVEDMGHMEPYEYMSTRTLQLVLKHDLMPSNLRYLQQPMNSKRHDVYPATLEEYTNLEIVLSLLDIYFHLLRQFHLCIGDDETADEIVRGMTHYVAHLRTLNEIYAWRTVLLYHMAFHELRRREMKRGFYGGWLTEDPDLMKRIYDLEESGVVGGALPSV
ncbi:hypothetical protein AX16_002082 [Volvariella volvacea WC 439]|nr:hypothetical protein AX16_002082 [Volvariella volvacea WC 439]